MNNNNVNKVPVQEPCSNIIKDCTIPKELYDKLIYLGIIPSPISLPKFSLHFSYLSTDETPSFLNIVNGSFSPICLKYCSLSILSNALNNKQNPKNYP